VVVGLHMAQKLGGSSRGIAWSFWSC